jgi:hypothetical protein
VRLSGNGPHGPVSFDVPVDTSAAAAGSVIGTLAARARIRELEESPEWIRPRASRQARSRPSNAVKEIVELAKCYGLVSRETSYIAVEEREDAVPGDVQLRRIPIAFTNGWSAMDTRAMAVLALSAGSDVDAPAFLRRKGAVAALDAKLAEHHLSVPAEAPVGSSLGRVHGSRLPRTAIGSLWSSLSRRLGGKEGNSDLRERVLAVVTLQRADGTWETSRALTNATALSYDAFLERYHEALASSGLTHSSAIADAWATAIACAWLERAATGLEQEWRMAASKGRRAIEQALGGRDVDAFLEAARRVVEP